MKSPLKKLRDEMRISLRDLGEKTDIDWSALSRIETGVREHNEYTLKQLSKFFNVTTDYLLGIEKPEDPNKPNIHSSSPLKNTEEYQNLIKLIDLLDRDQLILTTGMLMALVGKAADKDKKIS